MAYQFNAFSPSPGVSPPMWMPPPAGGASPLAVGNPAAQGLMNHLSSRFGAMSNWMPALDSMERFFRALPDDQRDLLHHYLFPADAAQLKAMQAQRQDPRAMADIMARAEAGQAHGADGLYAGAPVGQPPAPPAVGIQPPYAQPLSYAAVPSAPVSTPPTYAQPSMAFQSSPPPVQWPTTSWGGSWMPPSNQPTVVVLNSSPLGGPLGGVCGGWGGHWGGFSPYPSCSFDPFLGAAPFYGGLGVGSAIAGAAAFGVGGMLGAGLGALALGFL